LVQQNLMHEIVAVNTTIKIFDFKSEEHTIPSVRVCYDPNWALTT